MEIRQLETFVAVAKELHFGRAAERLHLAQPYLSKQVRQLERELGAQLFERTTRSVALTEAGHALMSRAQRLLLDVEQARAAVTAAHDGLLGEVSFGFTGGSSRWVIPVVTQAVQKNLPQVRLKFVGGLYTESVFARLADGSLDLGVVGLLSSADGRPLMRAGFGMRCLWSETLSCVLSAANPLAERDILRMSDLIDEPFVSVPASSGSTLWDVTHQACTNAGYLPRLVQEADDELTILTLVEAGVGVAILPSASMQFAPSRGLVWKNLAPDVRSFHVALTWDAETVSAATRAVLALTDCLVFRQRSFMGDCVEEIRT